MKQKFRLLTIVLLTIITPICILFNPDGREVDCHPQVYLEIVNNDTSDYIVKFKDMHTSSTPSDKIKFDDTTLFLSKNDRVETVIDYYWISVGGCQFDTGNENHIYRRYFWVKIQISSQGVMKKEFDYFPWDTSIIYPFNSDCTHPMYDTLFIP